MNFDQTLIGIQTKVIKGDFTLRDITMPVEIKAEIIKKNETYSIKGNTELNVKDFKIKIPRILSSKIAERVKVLFNLKYQLHDK